MSNDDLRPVVERLAKAGTEFHPTCVWLSNGRPIPDGVDLCSLEPGEWDCVWVPEFTVLGTDHPDAEFVAAQMSRFYGDPEYARRLEFVAGEMDMDLRGMEYERYDRDWTVPE